MRFLCIILLSALCARADYLANGFLRNGWIGSTNGVIAGGGGAGPGDGYEANLYAYFKMEDTSGGAVDSLGAKVLGIKSGTEVSASGKIGNALQFDPVSPRFYLDSGRGAGTSDDYDFGTHSFTVRAWVKSIATSGNQDSFIGGSGFGAWAMLYGSPPFGTDTKVDLNISDSGFSTHDLVSTVNIGDGAWHRIIAWYDSSGSGTAGLQIDNGTPVTLSPFVKLDDSPNNIDIGPGSGDTMWIDEVAFWMDYVLTSGDRTFDWNGGAGETYPLP